MDDQDDFEKGIAAGEVESGSDGKGPIASELEAQATAGAVRMRTLQAPEFIRNMTPEERAVVEARLKWKIDLRLMPMIILSMWCFFPELLFLKGLAFLLLLVISRNPVYKKSCCEKLIFIFQCTL
jgi:hypothetical protein